MSGPERYIVVYRHRSGGQDVFVPQCSAAPFTADFAEAGLFALENAAHIARVTWDSQGPGYPSFSEYVRPAVERVVIARERPQL